MKNKQQFLSPQNYISQRAKSLPIKECLIEKEYKELGITNVVIVRQEPGGKYTIGVFYVDIFCLGIKNAFCNCHLPEEVYEQIKERSFQSEAMEVSTVFAHNLIYGGLDYASEMGFVPHKDFHFSENVLDKNLIDDGIDEIKFGRNGKPCYFQGPNDNPTKIIAQLNKVVGEGNYDFISEADLFE